MATRDELKNAFANGQLATGEKFADLIDSVKVVQAPVVDPTALGTSLSFIDSISQDSDGKITVTKKTLDLANAHELNPFKGWYKTGDTLPTDGFDGAYLYFKDTSELTGQTTIYRWNGTAYADTGTVVDTSNVQTFETGQALNTVGIDTTELKNAGSSDLPKATDVQLLKQQLRGVTLEETKVQTLTEESGRINGSTGAVESDTYGTYCEVTLLSNTTKVRFLAVEVSNLGTYPYGWAFYDGESNPNVLAKGLYKQRSGSSNEPYELILDVPENAVTFKFTLSSANRNLKYCYLENGETVKEYVGKSIDEVNENLTDLSNQLSPIIQVDISQFIVNDWYINSEKDWKSAGGTSCYLVPVEPGYTYEIVKTSEGYCQYALLQNANKANNESAFERITDPNSADYDSSFAEAIESQPDIGDIYNIILPVIDAPFVISIESDESNSIVALEQIVIATQRVSKTYDGTVSTNGAVDGDFYLTNMVEGGEVEIGNSICSVYPVHETNLSFICLRAGNGFHFDSLDTPDTYINNKESAYEDASKLLVK